MSLLGVSQTLKISALRLFPREAWYQHRLANILIYTPPPPCSVGREITSSELEIECKPDQYLEVPGSDGIRMIRLDTWWTTVGTATGYEWSFDVIRVQATFFFDFLYGQWGSDPYGTYLQGGAGAAVMATVTANDDAGNTDSCSFLMVIWPEGSELKETRNSLLRVGRLSRLVGVP